MSYRTDYATPLSRGKTSSLERRGLYQKKFLASRDFGGYEVAIFGMDEVNGVAESLLDLNSGMLPGAPGALRLAGRQSSDRAQKEGGGNLSRHLRSDFF